MVRIPWPSLPGCLFSRPSISHKVTVASSPWKMSKTDCKKQQALFSLAGSDVNKSPLRQTCDFRLYK